MVSLMTLMAQADKVTPTIALQKAQTFMPQQAQNLRLVAHGEGENPAWYAFSPANNQRGGFIIMAGDDRVSQVLGYSDEGTFDTANMPENMRWWLKGCEEQIELLRQGKARVAHAGESRPAIAPMITSKWGQHEPYHLQTPIIDGHHAPTGCMPTAMAQILYYWKSKAEVSAMDSYTTQTDKIEVSALPATSFDYSIMKDEYERNDSSESAFEVAKLMRYCGQAFNVDYQALESGANGGSTNFVEHFHYDIHGFDLRRIFESRDEWDETLYGELAAGRPIFLSAISYQTGHGFVVDGYDGNGLYHINWGWYGDNDGYYLLDVACPGTEGKTEIRGEGYSIGQIASIGLRPASDDISYDDMALSVLSIETDALSYIRTSADEDFSISVSAQINNYYGATLSFDNTAAIFTTDGQLVSVGYARTVELQNQYGGAWTRYVDFGAGIESGSYILKMVSRLEGQETWNPDFGSYRHYVELTINGNEMTAVPVTNPFEKSLTINSMEVVGTSKVSKATTLKFNATNTGTYYINALYVMVEDVLSSAIGVPLDPGETGDFYIHVTPSYPGSNAISLRTSRYNPGTTIWSGSFEVADLPEPNLTIEALTVDGADLEKEELNNEVWRVLLDVKNNAAELYDGVFKTTLWKYDEEIGRYTSQGNVTTDVLVPAGEIAQVEVCFDEVELEIGGLYQSDTNVYMPSSMSFETIASSPSLIVKEMSTGIASWPDSQKLGPDVIYNISGQRIGTSSLQNLPSGFYIVGGKKFLQR